MRGSIYLQIYNHFHFLIMYFNLTFYFFFLYIFMCVHFYWLIRFNGHKPTTKKNFKYVIFYFFKTQGKNNHAPLPTMTKTS
jgi:hypothetical protein